MAIWRKIKRIWCAIAGHDYRKVKRLSQSADRIRCLRCGSDDAINYSVRCVVPYDDVRELYEGAAAAPISEPSP